jgi:hypothetical protein
VLVHHGHFPKDAASDGWRETPPDASASGTARDNQVAAYQFYKDWNGPKFPRMIHVLVQHPTPYFDDSYAVNSENNGPYGDAITLDLIPMIEKQFRGIGAGWARVTTGGSTGGWEAFGVQVKYPDAYNGAWALCPDPIDFRSYRSVNIYDDHNAYYYEDNPFKRTPKPGYRDYRDHLFSTFEDRNPWASLSARTALKAARRWASVFGPVGDDRYGGMTRCRGAIDPEVAMLEPLRSPLHPAALLEDAGPDATRQDPHHQRHDGQRIPEQRRLSDGRVSGPRRPVARIRNHLRRAPRALLHRRYRASEQCRQPHRPPALHAGDGAVDDQVGARGCRHQELGILIRC